MIPAPTTAKNAIAQCELVIFDCDGTIVDSEFLNNKAFSDILISYGLNSYTPEYAIANFMGLTISTIMLKIQMETGFEFPQDTVARYIKRVEELQQIELHPVKGAMELVRAAVDAGKKVCVASNGERRNVIRSLEITGLKPYFADEQVFTKIQVKNAKPAPDLFLFAAEQMNVEPERCIVIEDSEAGVTAGVAAKMYTIGFIGTSHDAAKASERLKNAHANLIVDDLIHIQTQLIS